MSKSFSLTESMILVEAIVVGPRRSIEVRLALDTGASGTTIRPHFLLAAGYNLASATRRVHIRAATGGSTAPVLEVSAIACLERVRTTYRVVAHDPPPAVAVDGILGLDFFRGLVLTLDFVRGQITLRERKPWWQFWK
jgi:predicted aspartyl protease